MNFKWPLRASRRFEECIRLYKTALVTAFAVSIAMFNTCVADAAINAGDRLSINVYNHPELTSVVTVDSRGFIQLPVAGSVHVAGLDSKDVAVAIRRLIEPYVPYPAVDVQDRSESQTIFVSGGPGGTLPFQPNESLSAAIAEIAKITPFSDSAETPPNASFDRFDRSRVDLKNVKLYRSGHLFGSFNLISLRDTADPGPILYANDTIALSNKPILVKVIGAVNAPGSTYLWNDEPLSDAIAQAGGPSIGSATGHIEVTRADQTSERVALGDTIFNKPGELGETIIVPAAPRVTVAGLVEHPGIVTLQNDFTLLSALAASGGYNKFGDLRNVQVVHQDVAHEYNIVALAHGDLSQNPLLHDGDTVFVPEGYKTDWSLVFQGLGGLGYLFTRI